MSAARSAAERAATEETALFAQPEAAPDVTAAYGHFGREPDADGFTWEKTDLVDALKAAVA
ncbi:hypothetical protein SJI45_13725 [Streptomyces sp. S399]|uniref:hypothetical protein n=1 Tax=Streptomyces sp. S399 TaxID=3096009 RepID=UPI002A801D29|nr:hypothetical protein [Streptomyces sp. S399]WPR54890.1 hypothetical protein SJI45_13725 [Streptomyces sp. S399]